RSASVCASTTARARAMSASSRCRSTPQEASTGSAWNRSRRGRERAVQTRSSIATGAQPLELGVAWAPPRMTAPPLLRNFADGAIDLLHLVVVGFQRIEVTHLVATEHRDDRGIVVDDEVGHALDTDL